MKTYRKDRNPLGTIQSSSSTVTSSIITKPKCDKNIFIESPERNKTSGKQLPSLEGSATLSSILSEPDCTFDRLYNGPPLQPLQPPPTSKFENFKLKPDKETDHPRQSTSFTITEYDDVSNIKQSSKRNSERLADMTDTKHRKFEQASSSKCDKFHNDVRGNIPTQISKIKKNLTSTPATKVHHEANLDLSPITYVGISPLQMTLSDSPLFAGFDNTKVNNSVAGYNIKPVDVHDSVDMFASHVESDESKHDIGATLNSLSVPPQSASIPQDTDTTVSHESSAEHMNNTERPIKTELIENVSTIKKSKSDTFTDCTQELVNVKRQVQFQSPSPQAQQRVVEDSAIGSPINIAKESVDKGIAPQTNFITLRSRTIRKTIYPEKVGDTDVMPDISNTGASSQPWPMVENECKSPAIFLRPSRMSIRRQTLIPRKSIINRRMSYQVVPSKTMCQPRLESQGFRDLHRISTFALPQDQPLNETDISVVEEEEEETSVCITAKDVVLEKCNQDKPLEFSLAFSKRYLKNCTKIGEGLYGEVFMYKARNQSTVFKIIPVDGEDEVNGERQKCCNEILSEIVITSELSNLRDNAENQTAGFVKVVKNRLLHGEYPPLLIDMWQAFADKKGTENDCPTMFKPNQLFCVLELTHGGVDLEKFHFNNAQESLAAFLQTAHALAVAEAGCEFEHRDLHWGNVLISRTTKKREHYVLNGEEILIPTQGIKVAIIDFTLSRITYDGCCLFNDLSLDPSLFESTGEYQFDIYRKMRDECGNVWNTFTPFSNVLWLHYLILKLIDETAEGVHYNKRQAKADVLHKDGMKKLKIIEKKLLSLKSAVHFVETFHSESAS